MTWERRVRAACALILANKREVNKMNARERTDKDARAVWIISAVEVCN